jgi:hypothetical protein
MATEIIGINSQGFDEFIELIQEQVDNGYELVSTHELDHYHYAVLKK